MADSKSEEDELNRLRRKFREFSDSIRNAAGCHASMGALPSLLSDRVADLRAGRDNAVESLEVVSEALRETIKALRVRLPDNELSDKRLAEWEAALSKGLCKSKQNKR